MRFRRLIAVVLVLSFAAVQQARASGSAPFAFGASVGPSVASRVDAYVTRNHVTLPAAAVPALEPGDEVSVQFPDYTRPPAKVNYHVNVAFITETPPVEWLYPKSGPQDRLFANPHGRKPVPAHPYTLRFTYGQKTYRGIPVFFLVPEDGRTRGMDGVRDYVGAHPNDFKDMSTSSNDAVERYGWFRDFLGSLAQGAIEPVADEQRIVSIASSLGASPSDVEACYTAGATNAEVANCVQTTLLSVQYQTNIDAPTQAQFFGGVAGAAAPLQMALYLEPLLAIWKIFSSAGHKEYEYLPTTLQLTTARKQLLMGLKVPTLRPPAAYSSVLFFTIGDPDAVSNPPSVVDDDKGTGICASGPRVQIPVHLDRTSQYVNDTSLAFSSEGGQASLQIPLDPRNAAAPIVERAKLTPGRGYDVHLRGRFGFDPIQHSAETVAHVAVPGNAKWQIQTVDYHPARAGGTLDAIASSDAAPCLSSAELQMAGNAPVALTITRLDDRRIELTGSLKDVPSGNAQIHLFQNDLAQHRRIADSSTLAIAPTPARVDDKNPPTAYLGDREIALTGSGFDGVSGLRIGPTVYTKTSGSQASTACFTGPPVGGEALREGSIVTAELIPQGGGAGQAFALHVQGSRPALSSVSVTPAEVQYHASEPLTIDLSSAQAQLPRQYQVRLRQAPPATSPCDALRDDATAVVVPASDVKRDSASTLAVSLRAGDVLHDDAFGTLQVQLVDAVSKRGSDWQNLSGQFAQ